MSMRHEVRYGPDNTVHVQNIAIMGFMVAGGQHHVYSKQGFDNWVKRSGIRKEDIHPVKTSGALPCGCGLKPGDVREYDGHVWHNGRFELSDEDYAELIKGES